MNIQEIAEELVNLSMKEVNELANVLNNDCNIPLSAEKYKVYDSDIERIKSPREYGESLRRKNKRKKY